LAQWPTCCAFAGDRGLLHEELTRSATREEAREVAGKNLDLYLCANRTCEVGMEHATRAPYESFPHSLEELTRTELAIRRKSVEDKRLATTEVSGRR
jgi:D-lactate dehydrogenase